MVKPLIAVIVVLLLMLTYVSNSYLNKRDELIKSNQALNTLTATHNIIIEDFKNQSTKLENLNREFGAIQVKKDIAVSKLNEYRGRENVVSKKPKTIERLANAATKRMFDNLCSSSGGDCGSKTTKTESDNSTNN